MKKRKDSLHLAAALIVLALVGTMILFAAPPRLHATIVIDGIKEADWGDPLAVDPLGDMTEPNFDLHRLYVLADTSYIYIGFDAFASTWGMTYGIYIDTDQIDGSGATSDPWGRNVDAVSDHLPEHTLYVWHEDSDVLQNAQLNHWDGVGWSYDSLVFQSGAQAYGASENWIEYSVPKSALGNPDLIALELFTTGGSGHAQDSVPSDTNVGYLSPDWGTDVTTLSAFEPFQPEVPEPIPEPSTVLLLGTGLVGLVRFRKKFKK